MSRQRPSDLPLNPGGTPISPGAFRRCCGSGCDGWLYVDQDTINAGIFPLCEDCARLDRQLLIRTNIEAIEIEYLNGLRKGIVEPTVILLDLRHHLGTRVFASWHFGEDRIKEMVARGNRDGTRPYFTLTYGAADVFEAIKPLCPRIALALAEPLPPGYFRVVACCGGGYRVDGLPTPAGETREPGADSGRPDEDR
jgi:hypothetical protein